MIYHNKNVRYIDEFCKQNGINVTVKDIKRFLEKSESGNLKYEKVNNKRISEENKGFTTRGRFFSQLHADTIHLSRKMRHFGKRKTAKKVNPPEKKPFLK